jgi:hypothetical protein
MNAMPMALAQLIYAHTNDRKYYKATVTLKHSKYAASRFRDILNPVERMIALAARCGTASRAQTRMCWSQYAASVSP